MTANEGRRSIATWRFLLVIEEDFLYYDVLWKPPPTCICNHSGDVQWLYSLVACEPNAMPAVSKVCWPNWNGKLILHEIHDSWNKGNHSIFAHFLFININLDPHPALNSFLLIHQCQKSNYTKLEVITLENHH